MEKGLKKLKKRISQEAAALVKLKGQQRARQKLSQQQTTHTQKKTVVQMRGVG